MNITYSKDYAIHFEYVYGHILFNVAVTISCTKCWHIYICECIFDVDVVDFIMRICVRKMFQA